MVIAVVIAIINAITMAATTPTNSIATINSSHILYVAHLLFTRNPRKTIINWPVPRLASLTTLGTIITSASNTTINSTILGIMGHFTLGYVNCDQD